jgi:hypothetical protein
MAGELGAADATRDVRGFAMEPIGVLVANNSWKSR